MRRSLPILISVLALLASGAAAVGLGLNRRFGPPDVVLITIDTLRADHVGALAPDSPAATPNMDALAADGVRYTQAFSPISVTGPAFTSLMTGQVPGHHGVVMNLFRGGARLPESAVTLAERFRDRRYATGAFVSGFTLRPSLGLAQGFSVYRSPTAGERRRPGDRTVARARRWMADLPAARRMLLWFHTYDTHGPLTPYDAAAPVGPRWSRDAAQLTHLPLYQRIDDIADPEFYALRYAAAVEHVDEQVGALVAALKRHRRYDRALIVLVADHGETLDEREPWMDHGTHASIEQLHVPLIVKYPGGERAGEVVHELVSLVDIAPTVLARAGLPPLPEADGQPLDTVSHPALAGESSHCKDEPTLDCAPVGIAGKEFALRTTRRAVIRASTAAGVRWTVYDRVADPAERAPLPDAPTPAERQRLDAMAADRAGRRHGEAVVETTVGAEDAGRSPGGAAADPEEAALRALGYVE